MSTFLKTVDVHVDDVHRYPDVLADLHAGRVDVLYVREAFARTAMEIICERLERNVANMQRTLQENPNPDLKQHSIYGMSFTPSYLYGDGPPLDDYLAAAARFRSDCRRLFEGLPDCDYETRIVALLQRLSGGREVVVASTSDGRHYSPATVRFVPEGCQIPAHADDSFLRQPVIEPLLHLIDATVLSFFVPIAIPSDGGELCIYNLTCGDPRTPRDMIGNIDFTSLERDFESESHVPAVGDLFVFNGGKYHHRVSPVSGTDERRWTIGGFLAFAKSNSCIYFWA